MHHLSLCSEEKDRIKVRPEGCQALVRFFALRRIKPHAPPLVRAPVNFEFHSCERTPRRGICVNSGTEESIPPTPSTHRLRRGLPGYLIPFAPHALHLASVIDQRVAFATGVPHIYAFHRYTRNSTLLFYTQDYQFQMQSLG